MCGIVGAVHRGLIKAESSLIKTSMDLIAHRGPDDEGIYCDSDLFLGHKRLAIIDLKGGRQPMSTPDGRYTIVYNGELYNYLELRERLLEEGHHFHTKSDTEVILQWVINKGEKGLTSLNGMFAFAVWDRIDKNLLLVRDRLGIKPLYYMNKPFLVFASEIKALIPWMKIRQADHSAIYEFLTYQNLFSERTFFAGVKRLQPGCWLKWSPQGIKQGRYWDISFDHPFEGDFTHAKDLYLDVLERSVSRHLISDVPLGFYLSGGFDSSTVATVASDKINVNFHTFTGAFTDSEAYDERVGSRKVAKNIGAQLHEVEIKPHHYLEHIGQVLYLLDEPTLGTGALPQYMVSKLVSKYVKVVLTGHGGDEMFGGYQVYKVALLKEMLRKTPHLLPKALGGIKRDEIGRCLYFLLFPLIQPEVRHGLFIMTPRRARAKMFTSEFLTQQRHFEPLDILDELSTNDRESAGQIILRLYLKTYLPTLFNQEDRMSMGHSIEARTPLCDNEMLDLAIRIPLNLKIWGNELKAITKKAMESRLPSVLYNLPKRGFPTPYCLWYREEPLKSFMADLLFGPRAKNRGIINTEHLRVLFERNLQSKTDNLWDYARANVLWSASAVELWFRTFIDQAEPTPLCYN